MLSASRFAFLIDLPAPYFPEPSAKVCKRPQIIKHNACVATMATTLASRPCVRPRCDGELTHTTCTPLHADSSKRKDTPRG